MVIKTPVTVNDSRIHDFAYSDLSRPQSSLRKRARWEQGVMGGEKGGLSTSLTSFPSHLARLEGEKVRDDWG